MKLFVPFKCKTIHDLQFQHPLIEIEFVEMLAFEIRFFDEMRNDENAISKLSNFPTRKTQLQFSDPIAFINHFVKIILTMAL